MGIRRERGRCTIPYTARQLLFVYEATHHSGRGYQYASKDTASAELNVTNTRITCHKLKVAQKAIALLAQSQSKLLSSIYITTLTRAIVSYMFQDFSFDSGRHGNTLATDTTEGAAIQKALRCTLSTPSDTKVHHSLFHFIIHIHVPVNDAV
jgi:hypothetical protein